MSAVRQPFLKQVHGQGVSTWSAPCLCLKATRKWAGRGMWVPTLRLAWLSERRSSWVFGSRFGVDWAPAVTIHSSFQLVSPFNDSPVKEVEK